MSEHLDEFELQVQVYNSFRDEYLITLDLAVLEEAFIVAQRAFETMDRYEEETGCYFPMVGRALNVAIELDTPHIMWHPLIRTTL